VLATGPGNPPAIQVSNRKMVRFGSRRLQKPDPELLGGANPHPYSSNHRLCWVWLDPSVPVSGSLIRVFLFMVAVIYVTVMCKILTLVHHSLYWFHWQPLYSKQGETCSISKEYSRPGGMAPSEWTRSVRAVRDTPWQITPRPASIQRVAFHIAL